MTATSWSSGRGPALARSFPERLVTHYRTSATIGNDGCHCCAASTTFNPGLLSAITGPPWALRDSHQCQPRFHESLGCPRHADARHPFQKISPPFLLRRLLHFLNLGELLERLFEVAVFVVSRASSALAATTRQDSARSVTTITLKGDHPRTATKKK